MNESLIVFILVGILWGLTILGGLGVGGAGKDSRDLGVREHSEERAWRSLLSR